MRHPCVTLPLRCWALVLAASVVLGGCVTAGGGTGGTQTRTVAERAQAARSADDLLVVDCLLPAQVRRLGSRVNFLAPRRPIKTSARDCEIRGGEYVAYDRANYQTALQVWLPLAREGDPEAQTYVGEIFERGFGGNPDYAAAAVWYTRAAEQGFSRAQTNLAALYEEGRGVPRDMAKAVVWYRRAAGLTAADFAALGLDEEEVARAVVEAPALRAELDTARRELAALRGRAEQARARERAARERLAVLEAQRERLVRELRQRTEPAAAAADPGQAAAVARLRQELAERRQEIAALTEDLTAARRELAQAQAEAARRLAQAQQALQSDAAAQSAELVRLRQELDAANARIDALQGEVAQRQQVEAELTQRIAQLNSEREALVRQIAAATQADNAAEVEELRRQLAAREAELAEREAAFQELQQELLQLEEQIAARIAQTAASLGLSRNPGRAPAPPAPERNDLLQETRSLFGAYHALVIGNNEFDHLPDLDTAAEDARAVARILEQRYGFSVRLLLDANRYEILSALNDFRAKLTENDNFLLYYAGHGELDRVNQRGHWLPTDAQPDNTANWISVVSITDILNAISVRHALVVVDSCYSGILTRTSLTDLRPGMSPEAVRKWLETIARNRVRVVLTSGGVAPVMDGGGGAHSVFARALIETLAGNQDILGGYDLYRQVAASVNAAAQQFGLDQVPEYAPIRHAGHEAGDFFFIPLDVGAKAARATPVRRPAPVRMTLASAG